MSIFSKKKKNANEPTEIISPTVQVAEKKSVVAEKPIGSHSAKNYHVVLGPIITEKVSLINPFDKYIFRVNARSNKIEIKEAIKELYNVEIKKVAVINVPAKERRLGRQIGTKPGYKKAIVTLKEGNKIDIAN